jgi:hypothetical protein
LAGRGTEPDTRRKKTPTMLKNSTTFR